MKHDCGNAYIKSDPIHDKYSCHCHCHNEEKPVPIDVERELRRLSWKS